MANIIVSFPRSGQHLTEKLLRAVHDHVGLPYSYCEHYGDRLHQFECKCTKFPCVNGCTFQKNHDWSLDLEVLPEHKYLVLMRDDPVKQMEAFYRHGRRSLRVRPREVVDFTNFLRSNIDYYRGFSQKWHSKSREFVNVRLIEYYSLIGETVAETSCILQFFGIAVPANIRDVISVVDVVRRNFSPNYYEFLRSQCRVMLGKKNDQL